MPKRRPAAFAAAANSNSNSKDAVASDSDEEPEKKASVNRRPKRQRVGAATTSGGTGSAIAIAAAATGTTNVPSKGTSTAIPPFGFISLEEHERILNLAKKRHEKEREKIQEFLHKEQEKIIKQKDQALQKAAKLGKQLQAQKEKLKEELKRAREKKKVEESKVKRSPFFNQAANINHVTDIVATATTTGEGTGGETAPSSSTTATPIQPNKIDKRWQAKYELLQVFKTEFGHCNCNHHGDATIKTRYPGLATWVSTQRTAFTWLKAGKKTTLTPHRIHLLKEIGFDWQPRKTDFIRFEQRIPQLQDFKDSFGHTNVPQNYTGTSATAPGLGNWVLGMRRKYRMGVLAPDKIATLEQMGFVWKLRNRGSGGGGGTGTAGTAGAVATTNTHQSPAPSPIRLPPVRVPRGSPWNRYNV